MAVASKPQFHSITARTTAVSSIRSNGGEKIGYRAMCYSCVYRDEFPLDAHDIAVDAVIHHVCRAKRKVEITEATSTKKVHHSNLRSGRYGQQTR
jgi:hypothetical protein